MFGALAALLIKGEHTEDSPIIRAWTDLPLDNSAWDILFPTQDKN